MPTWLLVQCIQTVPQSLHQCSVHHSHWTLHMCHTAAHCNYNGVCSKHGVCRCRPQWRGVSCDQLNLLPMRKSRPLGYRGVNSSTGDSITSWGGSVVHGDDGLWHMFAAEIAGSCGMNVWLSNSRVIHATSPDPTVEPFERRSVVAPVFAHEPIAARAPTGEYVLWYTAVLPPGKLPGGSVRGALRATRCPAAARTRHATPQSTFPRTWFSPRRRPGRGRTRS